MILTKDNLLRYVREKRAVTSTMVAEVFDTTTMIASAALSDVAKDKTIAITHLKLSSSPYYYDPRQKEYLAELGEKHLSKGEKEIFEKLKNNQLLSDNSLSIQERLSIEKIKDFAIPLEINHSNREIKFWVWYLRDINETKKQIIEAISPKAQLNEATKKSLNTPNISQTQNSSAQMPRTTIQSQVRSQIPKTIQDFSQSHPNNIPKQSNFNMNSNSEQGQFDMHEDRVEIFIENFLKQNYLTIDTKNKQDKGIFYAASLNAGKLKVGIDCLYYYKKPTESDIIKFYTSSLKPKIVFIEKCPKKLLKLSDGVENLTIVNI